MEQYKEKQFAGTNASILEQLFTQKGERMANMFGRKRLQTFISTNAKMIVMRQRVILKRMDIKSNVKRVKPALSAAAAWRQVANAILGKNSHYLGMLDLAWTLSPNTAIS